MVEEVQVEERFPWKKPWKMRGPVRGSLLLWQVVRNRVKTTKELLWLRIIVDSPKCDICGGVLDNTLHALRDCPPAKGIWTKLLGRTHCLDFWEKDIPEEWVRQNLNAEIGMATM